MIPDCLLSPARFVPGAALLAILTATLACGPSSGAPFLDDLWCADEASCQTREDPFTLTLAVNFSDPDGDLGTGTYSVYVDGLRTDGPNLLWKHFEAAGLAMNATEGTLVLPAPVQLTGIYSGKTFIVGIDVRDEAGNQSNRPGIRFRILLD